jgi:uncharacterized membrane protein
MWAELFAILAAAFSGIYSVLIKKGLSSSAPLAGVLVTLSINVMAFWILLTLYVPYSILWTPGIIFFIAAGAFAPFLGRTMLFIGIDLVGASVSRSIVGTSPVFAAFLAVIILHESLNVLLIIGIVLVVVGIVILSYDTTSPLINWKDRLRSRGIMIPLAGSFFYGTSVVLRKMGLDLVDSAIAGAAITSSTSLAINLFYIGFSGTARDQIKFDKSSFKYFIMGGIFLTFNWFLKFLALKIGDVVIVSPLQSTGALFTVLFSLLLLKNVERVNLTIVTGAILVVLGAIVVSLS